MIETIIDYGGRIVGDLARDLFQRIPILSRRNGEEWSQFVRDS